MVAGSGIHGHLLAALSVFVFILLPLTHGYSQEAPHQYHSSEQLQEPMLNTGALVRSVRRVAVIGMYIFT